jgi:hypothetical protein
MGQITIDTELFLKAEKAMRDNDDLKTELYELRPLAQLAKVIIQLQTFYDRSKEEWADKNAECRMLKKRVADLESLADAVKENREAL